MPEIREYEVEITYRVRVTANSTRDVLDIVHEAISADDHDSVNFTNRFGRCDKPVLVDTNIRRTS
jgi:hypothetical protein